MRSFRVQRDLPLGRYPFNEVAQGLEASVGLIELFGGAERLTRFLSHIEVEVASFRGYMWVDDERGCLVVSHDYLQRADETLLYLDLVHEVVHLRQLSLGINIFDERYSYHERPSEIEAYRVTVDEARRLGLEEDFLREYLKVDWITTQQHQKLVRTLGLEPKQGKARP